MKNYTMTISTHLQTLTLAGKLISDNKTEEACVLLDELLGQSECDDITRLCAMALRERSQTDLPMYLRDLEEEDKQINVFDLVLQSVPPVQVVSYTALNTMIELYSSGVSSFTHLNIGIGKGRFEMKMLQELSKLSPEQMPRLIKIIGIDIDTASLRETGEAIQHLANTLFPATTKIEYTPVFAFAEAITPGTWAEIQNHDTDLLGVVSAFTLHHIPTLELRQEVLQKIAACDPTLFMLLEPDVDHFTPDLSERLVNCWNLFGTIFKLVDQNGLQEKEAKAIKYKFFGREIEDILGNEEDKRSEKHEEADVWAGRLKTAGFNLHHLVRYREGAAVIPQDTQTLKVSHNAEQKFTTTEYEGIPMVAMFTASRQL